MDVTVNQPDVIREVCLYHAAGAAEVVEAGIRGLILGEINRAVALFLGQPGERGTYDPKTTDWRRRLILGYLFGDVEKPFGELSSKMLNDGQWYALKRWVFGANVVKQEYQKFNSKTGELQDKVRWLTRPGFNQEARQLCALAYHALFFTNKLLGPPLGDIMVELLHTAEGRPAATVDAGGESLDPEKPDEPSGMVNAALFLGGWITNEQLAPAPEEESGPEETPEEEQARLLKDLGFD